MIMTLACFTIQENLIGLINVLIRSHTTHVNHSNYSSHVNL